MTDETDVTGLIERLRRESKAHSSGTPGPRRSVMVLLDDTVDILESLQADVHNARETALANKSLAEEARAALEAPQCEADARVREAVLSERERCAKIAEDEGGYFTDTGSPPTDFSNCGRNDAARDIAAAIRLQETGDSER